MILPPLLLEVVGCLEKTLNVLISTFDCPHTDKQNFLDFKKEILGWYGKTVI